MEGYPLRRFVFGKIKVEADRAVSRASDILELLLKRNEQPPPPSGVV